MGAFAAASNSVGAFMATAIIAEQITPTPVGMIVGDSIGDGYGGSALGRSYLTRGLDAQGVAWYNCGNPGSNMVALALNYGPPIVLGDFVDFFIIHCGTNDIYGTGAVSPTFSAFQTNLLQYAKQLARPWTKLWLATIAPRTTSTDSWATYANQTPITSIATGGTDTFEALRIRINNWLRDPSSSGAIAYLRTNMPYGAAQVGGIIDHCPYIERNSDGSALVLDSNGQQTAGTGGRWIVSGAANYATADGIHPSDAAQILMSAAVPAASAFALS
jgi:lysophospholipase L1-like esterase